MLLRRPERGRQGARAQTGQARAPVSNHLPNRLICPTPEAWGLPAGSGGSESYATGGPHCCSPPFCTSHCFSVQGPCQPRDQEYPWLSDTTVSVSDAADAGGVSPTEAT